MHEAIFDDAPRDTKAASDWFRASKPMQGCVIGDRIISCNFAFANLLAADKNIGLPVTIVGAAAVLGVRENLVATGTGKMLGTAGGPKDTDRIRFVHFNASDITAERVGLDRVLRVNGTDDQRTVVTRFAGRMLNVSSGHDLSDDTDIREIIFAADGMVWGRIDTAREVSRPQPTDDRFVGTLDVGLLDGRAGEDPLCRGDDTDVYRFGRGYGHNAVVDSGAGARTGDVIELDANVFADLSAVLRASTQVGSDVVITPDVGNTVTLRNVQLSAPHSDDFRLSDPICRAAA